MHILSASNVFGNGLSYFVIHPKLFLKWCNFKEIIYLVSNKGNYLYKLVNSNVIKYTKFKIREILSIWLNI